MINIERTLAFRIDEEFHRELKVKLAERGVTLKSYVLGLIETDLRRADRQPIDPAEVNAVAARLQAEVDKLRAIAEG